MAQYFPKDINGYVAQRECVPSNEEPTSSSQSKPPPLAKRDEHSRLPPEGAMAQDSPGLMGDRWLSVSGLPTPESAQAVGKSHQDNPEVSGR